MVFGPCWSENRVYTLLIFVLESGMVFEGTVGAYEPTGIILLFQIQMNKKEIEIKKLEMHLKKFFVCPLI